MIKNIDIILINPYFLPWRNKNRLFKLNNQKEKTENIRIEIDKITGERAKKALVHSSLKTLNAFANSKGGTLLLGVNDYKQIIGLEVEFASFVKQEEKNRDGYGKYFDDLVRTYLGDSFSSLMTRKFIKFPEGDVLVVEIKPSVHEVFLQKNEEGKDVEQLYIRNLSSSKELLGSELAKYLRNKHNL